MRIAYLINQYPKVSHSFIRREILALEQQGFEVARFSVRGWDAALVDEADRAERLRCRYLLQGGTLPLLKAALAELLHAPGRFLSTLWRAARLGWRADRPLPYHLVYLLEACRLVSWLREWRADHLHAHFGTNSAEVALLARCLGGPPFSFTVHGPDEFDRPLSLKLREKIQHAAFVVAVSSFGRSQLYRWADLADWHKVQVVHCGLEQAFYAAPPTPVPCWPRLVCVGRLSGQKGQALLIEATQRLKQQGCIFELVLAGDGELRAELEALIHRHGLEKQVRITGWISSERVREELEVSRALVLPSFAEGLPVVIMEAMALGRPVISTYVAGIPELVRPGEHGWLVPAGDVEALAAAMQQVLTLPMQLLQGMGESARVRVLERHAIESQAARLGRLFRGERVVERNE